MERVSSVLQALQQSVAPRQTKKVKRVYIALFNGFALPKVADIIEVFQKANSLDGSVCGEFTRYDVSLMSAAGGAIVSSSSVFVWTRNVDSHRQTEDPHVIFIAGGNGAQQACGDERLGAWLRRAGAGSELVHPIAEGRLLFESAGLENCSRHNANALRAPADSLHAAPRKASSLKTALRIIEADFGVQFAQQVAEAVNSQHVLPQVSEEIMASARWLDANVDRPISIDDAARVAAMSERNFLRRFKSEIGLTPSDYLLRARLNMSRHMLIETGLPIDEIARRCGIGSGAHLSKLFRKYFQATPTEYRTRKDTRSTKA